MRLRSVASLNTSLIPVYSSYPPLHARYQTACSPPPAQSDQAAPRVLPTRMERRGPEGCLIRRRRNQHHWKIGENESKAEASAAVSHIAQRCKGESTPPPHTYHSQSRSCPDYFQDITPLDTHRTESLWSLRTLLCTPRNKRAPRASCQCPGPGACHRVQAARRSARTTARYPPPPQSSKRTKSHREMTPATIELAEGSKAGRPKKSALSTSNIVGASNITSETTIDTPSCPASAQKCRV